MILSSARATCFCLCPYAETSCDNGIVYNSTCYKIHRVPVNWFTAVNRCLANNGSLAVFDDQVLKYFAVTMLKQEHLWIGLIKSWWTWPDAGISWFNYWLIVTAETYSDENCQITFYYRFLLLTSLCPRLLTWHYPHLLQSAGACYRSISRVRGSLSSKPVARRCCCRSTGQTDGLTDARPFHRPCSAYYAVSVNNFCSRTL